MTSKRASASPRLKPQYTASAVLILIAAEPLAHSSPITALWTVSCILLASILITWGAESAQFFVAQGFALAILAWMQTLPEFAVEAGLAWRQQTVLMLAGLTGALRLLTGLAWPMIYFTAAVVHRKRTRRSLRTIRLSSHHSVEVAALSVSLVYALVIWWKGSLHLFDGLVLIAIYGAYLVLLTKLPPEEKEGIEDLEPIPKRIVTARRSRRNAAIAACFLAGGLVIYWTAEPFLGSLIAVAVVFGIPSFLVIQWLAPVISEFPELLSTFYFARKEDKASVALMNITSSNINQWTLLVAVLPIVYSFSRHAVSAVTLSGQQRSELLLTIGQSIVALLFLMNMEFDWWEAGAMFVLFAAQFVVPAFFGAQSKDWITCVFLGWAALEVFKLILKRRWPAAFQDFASTWRAHVR